MLRLMLKDNTSTTFLERCFALGFNIACEHERRMTRNLYDSCERGEVGHIDVVRTDRRSPGRDDAGQLVAPVHSPEEESRECRMGLVEDKVVGNYCSWQEFRDMTTYSGK